MGITLKGRGGVLHLILGSEFLNIAHMFSINITHICNNILRSKLANKIFLIAKPAKKLVIFFSRIYDLYMAKNIGFFNV